MELEILWHYNTCSRICYSIESTNTWTTTSFWIQVPTSSKHIVPSRGLWSKLRPPNVGTCVLTNSCTNLSWIKNWNNMHCIPIELIFRLQSGSNVHWTNARISLWLLYHFVMSSIFDQYGSLNGHYIQIVRCVKAIFVSIGRSLDYLQDGILLSSSFYFHFKIIEIDQELKKMPSFKGTWGISKSNWSWNGHYVQTDKILVSFPHCGPLSS